MLTVVCVVGAVAVGLALVGLVLHGWPKNPN